MDERSDHCSAPEDIARPHRSDSTGTKESEACQAGQQLPSTALGSVGLLRAILGTPRRCWAL
eukprot:9778966-Alexandrium_andersonii.AAC.1